MIGRRIPLEEKDGELRHPESWWNDARPGDYCGPTGAYTNGKPSVTYLLPNARDDDAPPGARSFHHVTSPPHSFRECADGSLEIRESISAQPGNTGWHGYLDEGHVWRQV